MRYVLALLLGLASISSYADEALRPGVSELRSGQRSGKPIIVRVNVASPSLERCAGWRWGAEAECPRLAVIELEVRVGADNIFVPRSAFADLGSPNRISLMTRKSGFDIVVHGGDAANSYVARLRFSKLEIKSRRVESGEFRDSAWENTTFSFTK